MKTILLAAIGITIAIMLLRESPPQQPPQPSKAVAPVALAAPKQTQAQITSKPVSSPKLDLKRIPAPLPDPAPALAVKRVEPFVVKGLEVVEPEFVPAATTASVAPPPAVQAPPPPNSVFGWGPWAAGQPIGGAGGGSSTPSARTEAPPPSVTVASSVPTTNGASPAGVVPPVVSSPPVIPPPQLGGVKPGHGFGDRNHAHRHKHFPDFAGPRGRDR